MKALMSSFTRGLSSIFFLFFLSCYVLPFPLFFFLHTLFPSSNRAVLFLGYQVPIRTQNAHKPTLSSSYKKKCFETLNWEISVRRSRCLVFLCFVWRLRFVKSFMSMHDSIGSDLIYICEYKYHFLPLGWIFLFSFAVWESTELLTTYVMLTCKRHQVAKAHECGGGRNIFHWKKMRRDWPNLYFKYDLNQIKETCLISKHRK